jgi:hypothetical protein
MYHWILRWQISYHPRPQLQSYCVDWTCHLLLASLLNGMDHIALLLKVTLINRYIMKIITTIYIGKTTVKIRNKKFQIYKTIILLVSIVWVWNFVSHVKGRTQIESVWKQGVHTYIHLYSIGCGISHNKTIHIIQVQFIPLYRFHIIQRVHIK